MNYHEKSEHLLHIFDYGKIFIHHLLLLSPSDESPSYPLISQGDSSLHEEPNQTQEQHHRVKRESHEEEKLE